MLYEHNDSLIEQYHVAMTLKQQPNEKIIKNRWIIPFSSIKLLSSNNFPVKIARSTIDN